MADVDVFHALSDGTRRQLLVLLRQDERAVTELAGHFDSSLPAISQHLAVLLRAGLVTRRRQGRLQLYSLQPQALDGLVDFLSYFDAFWDQRLASLGRHLEEGR